MNTNTSFTSEYQDMLEFIQTLHKSALEQSDILLSEVNDLLYKKRQQEYILQEREKKRVPNISMFSPLVSDDISVDLVMEKNELELIIARLNEAEEKWKKQNNICQTFEKLKKFFFNFENDSMKKSNAYDNLIDYSTKLLETQEMDRNRISRDLHDSTVQSLTSLGHKMEYCSKMVDRDPIKVKLELQSMIELNKEIINDMREIIYDLRPMSLNNLGLVSTVEAFCLHMRRSNNFDIIFKVEGEEQGLTSIISVTLYRIIQEACNNAVRHSKAKQVSVKISFLPNTVEINIKDNGIGFDIKEVEERAKEDILHGFGLSTMKERARLLSGSFIIDTKPGSGTNIKVVVPINYTSRKEEESYE